MTATTTEITEFVSGLVPGSAPGQHAIRAVIEDALRQWESREQEPGPQRTYLPTSDAQLGRPRTRSDLEDFRLAHGIREDWHAPDEQGITAYVVGDFLDNAFGGTVDHNHGELNVVICKEVEAADVHYVYRPVAVVNLATLLSWATSR